MIIQAYKKLHFFLLIVLIMLPKIVISQQPTQTGYPIKDYLSQINISDISISPNGKYIAIVTRKDNFEKNKTEIRLWQYEISNENTISSKTEIPIYENEVSQLKWTKDSDFLVFKSKDSISNNLFKVATKNPKIITPIVQEKEKLKNLAGYTILEDNTIIFYEKFSPVKRKEDSIVIKFPKDKDIKHSTFKSFSFSSNKIDSLFTIQANVAYFEVSPDNQKIIYTNFESSDFYTKDVYASSHTYVINKKDGSLIRQLTQDKVWDFSWWHTKDTIYSYFYGDPTLPNYNLSPQLYAVDLNTNHKKKLLSNTNANIKEIIDWKDQKLVVNATLSTSSNFFIQESDSLKRINDYKGTIHNLTSNKEKTLMAFSLIRNNAFEEVYIARSIEELNTPIKITDFNTTLTKHNPPEIEKITWKNSVGETIEGVVMWPPGKKGAKKLPLVVDIHGGPWSSRSEAISLSGLQYYYFASLLASKGFLVLLPNYSGGTGRGQVFLDKINGAPRTRPTDDIITGVEHMIRQNWVDTNRMIVKGASYGGLLTNSIIGETTMFTAALTSCGIWNETAEAGINDGDISQYIRFNDIKAWENPELYRKESAFYNAIKIKTPTLITHGENDVRVSTSNSYSMYYTLKNQNIETELLIFKGEGHLYKNPISKLAKVKAEMDFINKYIKL